MKREDSKKHYKEEKHDLRNAIIHSLVLLAFVFFSNLSAQIPINGFCRYREFSVKPNFTNLLAVDFNSDGYRDLVIYNPQSSNYLTLTSDSKSNFGTAAVKSSPLFLTALHPTGNDNNGKRYFALSRKTREVCNISFSRNGSYSINSKTKLNGFATSLDVGEINSDGRVEAIAVGTTLDGMKVLKSNGKKLAEADDIKGKIFSCVAFIDLNFDSFMDIAAFDVVSNSIVFYSNNGIGDFEESRSINVGSDLTEFRADDYNSDGFTDLTFLKDGHLQIMCGDSVSSFQKKLILHTEFSIDKYSILDFNGDGYNDVAYLDKAAGTLNISFGKGMNQFYGPVLYLKKNNLCDIVSYIDRGGRKLAALSTDGKVYLINSVSFQDEQFSVSLGETPVSIQSFDYGNDSYKDIAFIDTGTNSLKIGLSERRNLLRSYIEIPLTTHPSSFIVDDVNKNVKTFFCYSKGERTIEIVRYDFNKRTIQKLVTYTSNQIVEIKLLSDRIKDRVILYALIKEGKKLFLQNIEIRDFSIANSQVIGIALNADEAYVNLGVYRDVYYMLRLGNEIDLIKSIIDKKVVENSLRLSFEKNPEDNLSVSFAVVSELFNRYKPAAALLSMKKYSILYIILENGNIRIPLKKYVPATLPLKYSIENDDNISFLAYDNLSGKLYQLQTKPKEKSVKETALLEMKGINDYFVSKLDERNRYLICSNKIQNSITFKKF